MNALRVVEGGAGATGVPQDPGSPEHNAPAPPSSVLDGQALSWSRLSTWLRCGKAFELSYIQQVSRVPQGALMGGSLVHAVIEEAEAEGRQTDERWLAVRFLAGWKDALAEVGGADVVRWAGRKSKAWPQGEDSSWWASYGPAMLANYAALRQQDAAAGVVFPEGAVERRVTVSLPSGKPLVAIFDAFVVTKDGVAVVRDYKTGQVGRDSGFQLAVYAWAWGKLQGAALERGEYIYLRSADPERRVVSVDLRPLVPLVEAEFATLEVALEHEVFPMRPDKYTCAACSVRPHCPYGRLLKEDSHG